MTFSYALDIKTCEGISVGIGKPMRSQVGIIGGGPAGLLLARKLALAGIDVSLLERQSRDHVCSRIRAGVLEWGTVEQLRRADVSNRMDQVGLAHDGCILALDNRTVRMDFAGLAGRSVMVYGQTEITRDLYEVLDASGIRIFHRVQDVEIQGATTESPSIAFRHGNESRLLNCRFVAGCDGFHGVSRETIPISARTEYLKTYPFGWLGLLSESPPVSDELIYSKSKRGFSLASMRNRNLSRYYIQVPVDDRVENWSDDDFWDELRRRLPDEFAESLITGRRLEKSIAPLRSFVSEPMSYGSLFLCGDAAHIVPPTGAKGLNLAASDVHYLYEALVRYFDGRDESGLREYSSKALSRVWHAMRFSWWMSNLLHVFPEASPCDAKVSESEFDYLVDSENGRRVLAENYTGLPY